MKVVKSPDTDTQLVKALGDLCTEALTDTETQAKPLVIRGYVNRVSKPAGTDYVLITPLTMTRQATNVHSWDPEAGVQSVSESSRRRVQIDCYGRKAAAWAKTLAVLLRDENAADFLKSYAVAPLYCEDPLDMTSAEGDEQYHERFMINAFFQVNEMTALELEYFEDVNLYLFPQA